MFFSLSHETKRLKQLFMIDPIKANATSSLPATSLADQGSTMQENGSGNVLQGHLARK